MTIIKDTNKGVKYYIELQEKFSDTWNPYRTYTSIDEASEAFEKYKKMYPEENFRFVRSQWQVVE